MSCCNKILSGMLTAVIIIAGCRNSQSSQDPNEMVIRHTLPAKISSLDPGNISDTTSSTVASQIFECLYQYHFLKRPYELIPQLAESMPQVSDDGLTYTIKIKKGVYFTDDKCFRDGKGRELKAEDFVFSLKRIANFKYVSKNWWFLDGKIVGLNEFREYTKTCNKEYDVDYSRSVEGLQATDDYTIVIKLKKSWSQIVYVLAHSSTSIVAKEAVDYYKADIINHPVGTGAFMLKQWHRGSFVELVRNPNFRVELYPSEGEPDDAAAGYLDDAGKRLPFADRIIWTTVEEEQPAWLLFMQGRVDASGVPKDNYAEVFNERRELTAKMKQLNMQMKTFPDPATYWIGFNMEDAVLGKNKPLRMAISRAIDRKKYIDLFFNGRNVVADGFVPPVIAAYDPAIKEKNYSKYDPNEAITLVKEAERIYGGKLPLLKLAMPGTDSVIVQHGQFFKKQFDAIGLNVEMEYMDWPTYLEKTSTKSAQMFSSGWVADYPDAENFLQLFNSKNISPGANNFNYVNPEFDKLYERFSVLPDSPERTELYRQAERLVLEDYPAVFLDHEIAYVVYHYWYKNYKPHAFAYNLSKYRRIDLAERANYQNLVKTVK
jgi:oligopeptide transport system substrate-binding protein